MHILQKTGYIIFDGFKHMSFAVVNTILKGLNMFKKLLTIILILSSIIISCKKEKHSTDAAIEVSPDSLIFTGTGGVADLNVSMTGDKWTVASNQSWCTTEISSSTVSYIQLKVSVAPNYTGNSRNAELLFIVDSHDSALIKISQALLYPDYSDYMEPDATGMDHDAKSLAAQMAAGWNLGNTLEAPGGETTWGNPLASRILIDSVRAAGINTIRIPCAWNSYIEDPATCKLKTSWLQRVKEVIDYCYANNMYVILNSHWDGGWLEENPTYAKQASVNAKQKALWEQIAVYFRNYDEHLMFAGTNEVHTSTDPTSENFEVQMSYNQTFVDAVRSTGGKNAYRSLVIQPYNTNIDYAVEDLTIPSDFATNRLMIEVHYYDPWDFTGLESDATWATVKNLWGIDFAQYGPISSWGQEDWVDTQFLKMKTGFVDQGYPVILGEFGAIRRFSLTGTTLVHHLESRAHYYEYVARQAKNSGLVPCVWDNGFTGNFGSGIFNRSTGSVFDQQVLTAYMQGISAGVYPF
jgi:endoglucanase